MEILMRIMWFCFITSIIFVVINFIFPTFSTFAYIVVGWMMAVFLPDPPWESKNDLPWEK